ncbi:MAG TPA: dihydroxyacetone kinase subunit DhaL [Thermaerobacter sp.]
MAGDAAATVDGERIRAFIHRFAEKVAAHKDELTALDAAIGDADHGTNLDRGLKAALERLPGEGAAPADLLKAAAMALIAKVGGASGPLYGTAFLRAAAAAAGKEALAPADVVALFKAALAGIQERGKATRGEKTMVDALAPAVEALAAALGRGADLGEALAEASRAARQGSDATIPMVATKGRASYLGERSRGHRDPGSLSAALMMEAAAETLAGGPPS